MSDENAVRGISVSACCRAIGGLASGALRPRRPSAAELAAIHDAGLPSASTTVRLRALPQLSREVAAPVIAEGVRRRTPLRIGLRTFVLEHPRARILLEPSVATQVRSRVLATMPTPLRQAVSPPADILSTVEALHRAGIDPGDLDFALPTHLHWDHVSGLLDLPGLSVMTHRPEWDWAMGEGPAPAAGVRESMRDRPIEKYDLDGRPVLGFGRSTDVFGDGSVVLVDLAGHTPGSVGVLMQTERGPVLLAGDAAWHHLQVEQAAQKASFPGLFVDEDRETAYRTLLGLHVARERVHVLPSHDHDRGATWE